MSIITISRRSFSQGSKVAEKVADKLGYDCFSREILLDASNRYNIPELKLSHALEDSPGILDKFSYGREKYLAYIRAALLKKLQSDNVVYHGYAGHLTLQGISHVLKTQLIGNIEDRINLYIKETGGTREKAVEFLNKLDDQRRKWAKSLHGIDNWNSTLFDLVVNMNRMGVNEAAEVITGTVGMQCFQTSPESQKRMDDLCLAVEVKAALMETRPDAEVSAKNGSVHIETKDDVEDEHLNQEIKQELNDLIREIPGVKETEIRIVPYWYSD